MNQSAAKRLEVGFALFLMAVFGVLFVTALGYPKRPRELPLLVSGLALILIAVQLAQVVRDRRKTGTGGPSFSWRVPACLFGGLALTLFLAWLVGLVPASAVLVFLSGRVIGAKRIGRLALVAVVTSAAIYVVFVVALGVPLPEGVLFGG